MATLELYVNKQTGAFHNFIKVVGTRRNPPEGDFKSQNTSEMLAKAVELLEGDGDYEPYLRVFDFGGRMIKGGGTTRYTILQLKGWTQPGGVLQPRVNEAILGAPSEEVRLATA